MYVMEKYHMILQKSISIHDVHISTMALMNGGKKNSMKLHPHHYRYKSKTTASTTNKKTTECTFKNEQKCIDSYALPMEV